LWNKVVSDIAIFVLKLQLTCGIRTQNEFVVAVDGVKKNWVHALRFVPVWCLFSSPISSVYSCGKYHMCFFLAVLYMQVESLRKVDMAKLLCMSLMHCSLLLAKCIVAVFYMPYTNLEKIN